MAKTKISEYSATAANNTDVESVNIAEGCAPSGINNAIREVMSHLKDFQTGSAGDSLTVGGTLTSGTVDINGGAIDGTIIGATTPAAGTFTQANFADNAKAIFGADSDLQIWHNSTGGYSIIRDAGFGDLYIEGSSNIRLRDPDGRQAATFTPTGSQTFYHNNSVKLDTTSTGIDVTGTVVADGLVHEGDEDTFIKFLDNRIYSNVGGTRFLDLQAGISELNNTGAVEFNTGASLLKRLNIATNGDISFYEDTGTTAKFFWDASAESLGIGTSLPAAKLHVYTGADSSVDFTGLRMTNGGENGTNLDFYNAFGPLAQIKGTKLGAGASADDGVLTFSTAINSVLSEKMRITNAGNLGLGVTPSAWGGVLSKALELSGGVYLTAYNNPGTQVSLYLGANNYYNGSSYRYSTSRPATQYQQVDGKHVWSTAPSGPAGDAISFTQAMTLTAAGNLGIGTTSPARALSIGTAGSANGQLNFQALGSSSYGNVGAFNTNSNGDKIIFYNDGTSYDGRMGVGTSSNLWIKSIGTSGLASIQFVTGTDVSFAERMRIDSAGNVGIGTSSLVANRMLTISGANGVSSIALVRDNNSVASGTIDAIGSDGLVDASIAIGASINGITFSTGAGGATERARIDSSGNLLVGTTSSSGTNTQGLTVLSSNSGTRLYIGHATGTANGTQYVVFNYAGTNQIGSISQSGTTAVLYNTTSDQRLKENIVDADSASELIDSLQVRQFDWKSENSHQRYGFVAQELVNVAPEAVHQPADPEEMMAVDYSKLVPMLVKEIQSLRQRLADAGI